MSSPSPILVIAAWTRESARAFAASALFRLAEVRRKQDRKDDAIVLYQKLLVRFPEAETEAKLAREAEICYVTIALVTDFDCWHPEHDAVTVADIIANLQKNSANAQRIIRAAMKRLPMDRTCKCGQALQHAILTDLKKVPDATRQKLKLLLQRYL